MSTREKILVAAAALALLYGIYEVAVRPFFTHRSHSAKALTVSSQGSENSGLSGFISQAVSQARAAKPGARDVYIIHNRNIGWKRDPFISAEFMAGAGNREGGAAAGGKARGEGSTKALTYSGYVAMGGIKFAVINGREYEEGDTLKDGRYVLRHIYPSKVVLTDGAAVITVKLKESEDGVNR